ncbi:MFS transporter [Gynuella sunshinyii]|uniref:MFS transporter n=1 Tax=Gynuella sunshinyii TaxID=1445505 RepID=UPI0005CC51C6|nr:MFS transporter [Gynuella sunshinyii]
MTVRDKLTLAILVLMTFFLMCDLYITPAIIDDLAIEYQVSHASLSWVGSAFALVGALISLVIGYKADRTSRKKLLIWTVLIGELPCFLTGLQFFTETYSGFFLLRVLTGIGVGGVYPITFSLIGDYFQERHRATASACVDLAWGLGMMVGPVLGTLALTTDYGWRSAFIWASVPNYPLVILFALMARDPKRGQTETVLAHAISDGADYQYRIQWHDLKTIFTNRTNLFCFLQGIPGSIPWGLFPFWLIVMLGQIKGLSREDATWAWELFAISAGISGVIWAVIGDRLFVRKAAYLPAICSAGVFIGMVPMLLLFNLETLSLHGQFTLMVIAGILISVPASNMKAIIMNVNRPEHRATVFSLFNLADNIGKGTGPAIGGLLLSVSGSYVAMANYAIGFWLLCGSLLLVVTLKIGRDRRTLTTLLEQRAEQLETHTR